MNKIFFFIYNKEKIIKKIIYPICKIIVIIYTNIIPQVPWLSER